MLHEVLKHRDPTHFFFKGPSPWHRGPVTEQEAEPPEPPPYQEAQAQEGAQGEEEGEGQS